MDMDVHLSKQSDGSLRPTDSPSLNYVNSIPTGTHVLFTVDALSRTSAQNRQSHRWYHLIGERFGHTPAEAKNLCKLHFGVPLMRATNVAFNRFYEKAIWKTMTEEEKLGAMDFIPLTSIMSKSQTIEYMETIQRQMAVQGLQLD